MKKIEIIIIVLILAWLVSLTLKFLNLSDEKLPYIEPVNLAPTYEFDNQGKG